MAVSQFPEYRLWVGLSTDDKPSNTDGVRNGDKFIEVDTSKEYRYNLTGTAWVQFKQKIDVDLEVSDLQIGAIEIKNSTDDTRATVGANGLHVDVQNLPNTVETDITAIKTAIEILDNAISGSEMQVDVVSTANSVAENIALSQIGSKAITGTSAVTPASGYYFASIQAISDIVVSAQGNVSGAINADLTEFTSIPAGTFLLGKWNSITLTSGEAIGHYAAE